jgi:phosphoglycerate dehydrogenase-like enzyme
VRNVHVLLGTERFSSRHSWSELAAPIPAALSAAVDVQWCAPGAFADRPRSDLIDVVVPLFSELDAQTIHAGQFGLIQQCGAGVENLDIEAATSAGVWVANMPGLNAVEVAEHAVLLLLALLRGLPEAPSGFRFGHWGDPPGEALAGSTVCIVALGAVGSQLARRLELFDVRLVGVRRNVRRAAPAPTPDIEIVGAAGSTKRPWWLTRSSWPRAPNQDDRRRPIAPGSRRCAPARDS